MKRSLAFSSVLAILAVGCSSSSDKGPEAHPLDVLGEKFDSFANPTDLGTLAFYHGSPGGFAEGRQFLSYEFEITEESNVSIWTSSPDENVDTVIYLYRRGEAGWGSYVAKDDDGGLGKSSKLEDSLAAGSYRIIVKGHSYPTHGGFGIWASCTGSGCPAMNPAPCDDTVEEWLRECAEEQVIESDYEMALDHAVEMCTDTPFAGLGDEPDEAFSDLCDYDYPSAICPAGLDFFVYEAVPACATKIVDGYHALISSCPVEIEYKLSDCGEEYEANGEGTFEEGVELCSEYTSEMHEELCAHDGAPEWCELPFDTFVDTLLAMCLHDMLS